jgi:hypothetical protein
MACA